MTATEHILTTAELAHGIAPTAKCRRSQVAAVITRDGDEIARGVNGTVDGPSCLDGGCPRGLLDYTNAPLGTPSAGAAKCVGVHAEMAAILHAARHGHALDGAVLYVTKQPCRTCARHIGQAGIREVVVVPMGDEADGTRISGPNKPTRTPEQIARVEDFKRRLAIQYAQRYGITVELAQARVTGNKWDWSVFAAALGMVAEAAQRGLSAARTSSGKSAEVIRQHHEAKEEQ